MLWEELVIQICFSPLQPGTFLLVMLSIICHLDWSFREPAVFNTLQYYCICEALNDVMNIFLYPIFCPSHALMVSNITAPSQKKLVLWINVSVTQQIFDIKSVTWEKLLPVCGTGLNYTVQVFMTQSIFRRHKAALSSLYCGIDTHEQKHNATCFILDLFFYLEMANTF